MARQRTSDSAREASTVDPDGVKSAAQEIPFLPPRQGRQWTLAEIDREMRDLKIAFSDAEGEAAARTWRIARKVAELYGGFPERAKGHTSFVKWFCAETGWSADRLFTYLRIQKVFRSDELAREYGITHLASAARLMELLSINSLATLQKTRLPQPGGEPVAFGTARGDRTTTRQLEDAIALLERGVTAQDQDAVREAELAAAGKPDAALRRRERLARERDLKNEKLRVGLAHTPGLEDLHSRFVIQEGELMFEAGRVKAAQVGALAKLLAKVDRST